MLCWEIASYSNFKLGMLQLPSPPPLSRKRERVAIRPVEGGFSALSN